MTTIPNVVYVQSQPNVPQEPATTNMNAFGNQIIVDSQPSPNRMVGLESTTNVNNQGHISPPQGQPDPALGYASPPQGYANQPQGYASPPQGLSTEQPQAGYASPVQNQVYATAAPQEVKSDMAELKPVQLADLNTIEPNQFYEIGGNSYISDDKGILVEVGSIIANSPELIEAISPQGSPQQMDVTNDNVVPVQNQMTTSYTMSAPGTSQRQNIIQSAMAQSQLPVTVNNPDIQTDFFDENDIATDDAQPIAQIMRGLKPGQIGECADLYVLIQCFF